jgi:DNA-binding response OmpR family regulator
MDKSAAINSAPKVLIASVDYHHTAQLLQECKMLPAQAWSLSDGDRTYLCSASPSRPDLILMDVALPKLDGLATCRLLRDNASTAHIPVMLFGTSASVEHRLLAFQAGAVDYLRKPFDPAELLARVRARLPAYRDIGTPGDDLPAEEKSEDELLVQMTMWYLEQRTGLPPPRRLLARQMGVSEAGLSRAFNVMYGKSPKAAFLDARLSKARRLLAENQLSVSQVAGFLGYAGIAGFSTAFRQRWGQSPLAYRTRAAPASRQSTS